MASIHEVPVYCAAPSRILTHIVGMDRHHADNMGQRAKAKPLDLLRAAGIKGFFRPT